MGIVGKSNPLILSKCSESGSTAREDQNENFSSADPKQANKNGTYI